MPQVQVQTLNKKVEVPQARAQRVVMHVPEVQVRAVEESAEVPQVQGQEVDKHFDNKIDSCGSSAPAAPKDATVMSDEGGRRHASLCSGPTPVGMQLAAAHPPGGPGYVLSFYTAELQPRGLASGDNSKSLPNQVEGRGEGGGQLRRISMSTVLKKAAAELAAAVK